MNKKETVRLAHHKLATGVIPSSAKKLRTGKHKVPEELRKILNSDPKALAAWEDITPLARNEWICWIESVKKEKTRRDHIERTRKELIGGKRRPCCWAGCRHTTMAMRPLLRSNTPRVAARLAHGRPHR